MNVSHEYQLDVCELRGPFMKCPDNVMSTFSFFFALRNSTVYLSQTTPPCPTYSSPTPSLTHSLKWDIRSLVPLCMSYIVTSIGDMTLDSARSSASLCYTVPTSDESFITHNANSESNSLSISTDQPLLPNICIYILYIYTAYIYTVYTTLWML